AFSGIDAVRVSQIAKLRLPIAGSTLGRAAREGRAVQVLDASSDPTLGPQQHEFARSGNVRTVLAVPLMRDGKAIGGITLARTASLRSSPKNVSFYENSPTQKQ